MNGVEFSLPFTNLTPEVARTKDQITLTWPGTLTLILTQDRISGALSLRSGPLDFALPYGLGDRFQKVWDALAGKEIVTKKATLTLPVVAPIPSLKLKNKDTIHAQWRIPGTATKGLFTADLVGVFIRRDHIEVDVRWKLLGKDMADNPVISYAEFL